MILKVKKPIWIENRITKERWLCDDFYNTKEIDGQLFLEVHKEDSFRKLLVKKDILDKVKK